MLSIKASLQASEWNLASGSLPFAHILQTWEWGQVKSCFGWSPCYKIWKNEAGRIFAMALILEREIKISRIMKPIRVIYIPKGPVFDWYNPKYRSKILLDLREIARQRGAVFIKIDPDILKGTGIPGNVDAEENPLGMMVEKDLWEAGWCFSPEQIQFRNTVAIDLLPDAGDLLANMKQKTRYNIRLAERKGVEVRKGTVEDIEILYKMYGNTSIRDNFAIREMAYYQALWKTFIEAGMAVPLLAQVEGTPIAAIIPFFFAGKSWYLFGMSCDEHREKMPNYLLQWQAMLLAKEKGCRTYDLWGAPDVFDVGDSMWNVFRFKEGFGGKVVRHIGAWDFPNRRNTYYLYKKIVPCILSVMRRIGRIQTQGKISL